MGIILIVGHPEMENGIALYQNYCYMYTQFVAEDIGKLPIRKLKRSDVKRFYNKLADERGLKAATIDNVHTVLH